MKIIFSLFFIIALQNVAFAQAPTCENEKMRIAVLEREKQLDLRSRQIEADLIAKKGMLEVEYRRKMALGEQELSLKRIATDKTIRDRLQAMEKELIRREADFQKQLKFRYGTNEITKKTSN